MIAALALGLVLMYLQGEPRETVIDRAVAERVGLPAANGPYQGKTKSYTDGDGRHVVYLLTQHGRVELVMLRRTEAALDAFRASPAGVMLGAAHTRAGRDVTLPGEESQQLFDRELGYWSNQAEMWHLRP